MISYYPMESIRDIIVTKNYTVKTDHERPVPLPSWNRYPSCPIIKHCRQIECDGHVSIFINNVNNERGRWIYLDISYFREKERAFIRTDNLQLLILFELGIVDFRPLQGIIETF